MKAAVKATHLDLASALDHLAVVEARAKNVGKPTHSTNDVRAKLGLAPLSK